jgi:hypothetical protein
MYDLRFWILGGDGGNIEHGWSGLGGLARICFVAINKSAFISGYPLNLRSYYG